MLENVTREKELTPEQKKEQLIKLMAAETAMRSAEKKRGSKTVWWAIIGGILMTFIGIIATYFSPSKIYIGAIVVGPISFAAGVWSWYANRD